ncbi:ATP-grasp ribosomal peptide maturase [Catenulispora sp. NF23]|uniref:ATP-grasp ribosomal peptide maturase n=1 Tax=Catenulispora pinistramenti TaxID=2705254 RepID=UPI001BA94679|nr:ATP-grasp ribosomal peptide maturase [Catenulispora pinistramenti]MBS2533272.1 ATP-grasp ribosomal peptide maturase [Catenulispora pinistramenti]
MTAAGTVLMVTELQDATANSVIAELHQRGVPVARFNLSDIGPDLVSSAYFGDGLMAGWLRTSSRSVDLRDVRSLLWRRPVWPEFGHLPDHDAAHAVAQVRYGLGGVLYGLPGCLYVNHPLRNRDAEYKPLQLDLAQRAGFRVPPTLISNDLAEIREFIGRLGPVIHKALRWTPYYLEDGTGASMWTEPVATDELDESVIVASHLFQAQVPKVADVRVVVVGNQVFPIRIDSGLLDWRRDYSALKYSVTDLPDGMAGALVTYLRDLGLASGSFDLCIDRNGDFYWLELNPNGQWGWLEAETGLPLAAAFADLLERGEL